MRAAFAAGHGRVDVREAAHENDDEEGSMTVRMAACGICGSDVEKVFGRYGQPSMRLGHEPAGIVVRAGGAGREAGIAEGDRVFTHHHVPCYSCHLCARGAETMCPRYYESNLSPCGLAEEYEVPAWNVRHGGVLRIPDSMALEDAAMIEPLACCVRAWSKAGARRGDTAAIWGMGATGMMHAMLARHYGLAGAVCADVNAFRLEFAGRELGRFCTPAAVAAAGGGGGDEGRSAAIDAVLGATDGRGADVAIVAAGSMKALSEAIRAVRRGGTVVMFGVPSRGETVQLDMAGMYSREVTLTSTYAASDRDTAEALSLISSGRVRAGRLVTHRFPLDRAQDAFDLARSGDGAVKVVVSGPAAEPGGGSGGGGGAGAAA